MSCRFLVQRIWQDICLLAFMGRCCGVSPFHHVKGKHGKYHGLTSQQRNRAAKNLTKGRGIFPHGTANFHQIL